MAYDTIVSATMVSSSHKSTNLAKTSSSHKTRALFVSGKEEEKDKRRAHADAKSHKGTDVFLEDKYMYRD